MSVGWQQLSLRWVADTRGVIRAKPGGPFPVMEGRGSHPLTPGRRAPGGLEVEGLQRSSSLTSLQEEEAGYSGAEKWNIGFHADPSDSSVTPLVGWRDGRLARLGLWV